MSARRTTAALAGAVLMALLVTGCGNEPTECEDDDVTSQSLVTGRGGTGGGGGGVRSGGTSGGKHKSPKVHIDSEDCD